MDKICKIKNSNCLVGLSGLSQVNSINVVRKLLENKNTVEVFINKNSIILEEVTEKLNNLICCGEGICGACTVNLNGERVKSCKAQINSRNLLDIL